MQAVLMASNASGWTVHAHQARDHMRTKCVRRASSSLCFLRKTSSGRTSSSTSAGSVCKRARVASIRRSWLSGHVVRRPPTSLTCSLRSSCTRANGGGGRSNGAAGPGLPTIRLFSLFPERDPRTRRIQRKHQRRIPSIPDPSRQVKHLPPSPHITTQYTTCRSHSPAAKAVWVRLWHRLLRAPLAFHDASRAGRFSGVCTRDIFICDETIRTYISTRSPQALECSRSFASSFRHSSR